MFDQPRILAGFGAHLVVNMAGNDFEGMLPRKCMEVDEEAHGIHATGHGDEDLPVLYGSMEPVHGRRLTSGTSPDSSPDGMQALIPLEDRGDGGNKKDWTSLLRKAAFKR